MAIGGKFNLGCPVYAEKVEEFYRTIAVSLFMHCP